MTTFPNSPRLLNGGIVLLDAGSGATQRIIDPQYNLRGLNRSQHPEGVVRRAGRLSP